jgi:hypothetical protein
VLGVLGPGAKTLEGNHVLTNFALRYGRLFLVSYWAVALFLFLYLGRAHIADVSTLLMCALFSFLSLYGLVSNLLEWFLAR